jgi:hypothetical protein
MTKDAGFSGRLKNLNMEDGTARPMSERLDAMFHADVSFTRRADGTWKPTDLETYSAMICAGFLRETLSMSDSEFEVVYDTFLSAGYCCQTTEEESK